MDPYVAEFFGTTVLLLLGNGVVANVVLNQTKGNNAGWIVITTGWGLAVYTAVLFTADSSGAHLNPAVTFGLAVAGEFMWSLVPGYVIAQMTGGFVGAIIVYIFYKSHYDVTPDGDAKLASFCTGANIRSVPLNLFCEAVATFILVFAALMITDPEMALTEGGEKLPVGLGSIGAIRVGLIVFVIGLCLGGTTGYGINPARDLSPRFAHAILPIKGKRDSDWAYAWIPVAGPILGGLFAGLMYRLISI